MQEIADIVRHLDQIERGQKIIIGGDLDVEYVRGKITKLMSTHPDLTATLQDLLGILDRSTPTSAAKTLLDELRQQTASTTMPTLTKEQLSLLNSKRTPLNTWQALFGDRKTNLATISFRLFRPEIEHATRIVGPLTNALSLNYDGTVVGHIIIDCLRGQVELSETSAPRSEQAVKAVAWLRRILNPSETDGSQTDFPAIAQAHPTALPIEFATIEPDDDQYPLSVEDFAQALRDEWHLKILKQYAASAKKYQFSTAKSIEDINLQFTYNVEKVLLRFEDIKNPVMKEAALKEVTEVSEKLITDGLNRINELLERAIEKFSDLTSLTKIDQHIDRNKKDTERGLRLAGWRQMQALYTNDEAIQEKLAQDKTAHDSLLERLLTLIQLYELVKNQMARSVKAAILQGDNNQDFLTSFKIQINGVTTYGIFTFQGGALAEVAFPEETVNSTISPRLTAFLTQLGTNQAELFAEIRRSPVIEGQYAYTTKIIPRPEDDE